MKTIIEMQALIDMGGQAQKNGLVSHVAEDTLQQYLGELISPLSDHITASGREFTATAYKQPGRIEFKPVRGMVA
ncbi:MAG: hypothetical protein NT087_10145 [Deltaproteobacteria bacterium]|nr:hypothetical protein [Deltaproteobacteria bacterium]